MENNEMKNKVTCENCGEVMNRDDALETANGYLLCEDCYNDCPVCYDCGETFYGEDAIQWIESEEEYFCSDCVRRHFSRCDGCGEVFRDRYMIDGYCVGCHQDNEIEIWDDKPYEFEPLKSVWNKVSPSTGKTRYFGLELETDGIEDGEHFQSTLASATLHGERVFYFCHDCSLSNRGIEVVTQPVTLGAWEKSNLLDKYETVVREVGANSYDNNAGLHIHVNRDSLGADAVTQQFNIGKIALVMDGVQSVLAGISRREDCDAGTGFVNRWGKKSAPLTVDLKGRRDEITARFTQSLPYWYSEQREDRYRALNVQPFDTIEFRFFGNAISKADALASIQAVNCLIEYAVTHTVKQCAETRTLARWFRDDTIPVELFHALRGACLI